MSTVYVYDRSDLARSEAGGTPGGEGYEGGGRAVFTSREVRANSTTLYFIYMEGETLQK